MEKEQAYVEQRRSSLDETDSVFFDHSNNDEEEGANSNDSLGVSSSSSLASPPINRRSLMAKSKNKSKSKSNNTSSSVVNVAARSMLDVLSLGAATTDHDDDDFVLLKGDGWGLVDRFFHNTFSPAVYSLRRILFFLVSTGAMRLLVIRKV